MATQERSDAARPGASSAENVHIRTAIDSDRDTINARLSASGLPVDDLWDAQDTRYLVAESSGAIVGCAGAELCGDVALLRSLAVSEEARGKGIGGTLVTRIEALCRDEGVRETYLLTQTAEAFFLRRGYSHMDRPNAPSAIAGSSEFSRVCPTSAAFMAKTL